MFVYETSLIIPIPYHVIFLLELQRTFSCMEKARRGGRPINSRNRVFFLQHSTSRKHACLLSRVSYWFLLLALGFELSESEYVFSFFPSSNINTLQHNTLISDQPVSFSLLLLYIIHFLPYTTQHNMTSLLTSFLHLVTKACIYS